MLIESKKRRGKNPVTVLSKGFEEDLLRQGYAPGTIWKHRKLLNDLSGWLQGQQIAMGDLSMAQVDRFMADRRAAGVRKLKTRKALGPILDHLRGLGLVPVAEVPVVDGPCRRNPEPVPTVSDGGTRAGPGDGPSVFRLLAPVSGPQAVSRWS